MAGWRVALFVVELEPAPDAPQDTDGRRTGSMVGEPVACFSATACLCRHVGRHTDELDSTTAALRDSAHGRGDADIHGHGRRISTSGQCRRVAHPIVEFAPTAATLRHTGSIGHVSGLTSGACRYRGVGRLAVGFNSTTAALCNSANSRKGADIHGHGRCISAAGQCQRVGQPTVEFAPPAATLRNTGSTGHVSGLANGACRYRGVGRLAIGFSPTTAPPCSTANHGVDAR
ncbi:Uncharacterised protein [Pandoraea pulmonicola]|uniref:Uncharacterized protein n=1 Tax=Pandoraea pulmonicola TaxID=93221 RepID=A0AAJ4Z9F0_PANPU|nr:Uncharacterised protein [Pandoraea pulmonicola]